MLICDRYLLSVLYIIAYFCDNWKIVPYATHTNTASNTWCRAPGIEKLRMAIVHGNEKLIQATNKGSALIKENTQKLA